jgi:hypothetical protein
MGDQHNFTEIELEDSSITLPLTEINDDILSDSDCDDEQHEDSYLKELYNGQTFTSFEVLELYL